MDENEERDDMIRSKQEQGIKRLMDLGMCREDALRFTHQALDAELPSHGQSLDDE